MVYIKRHTISRFIEEWRRMFLFTLCTFIWCTSSDTWRQGYMVYIRRHITSRFCRFADFMQFSQMLKMLARFVHSISWFGHWFLRQTYCGTLVYCKQSLNARLKREDMHFTWFSRKKTISPGQPCEMNFLPCYSKILTLIIRRCIY